MRALVLAILLACGGISHADCGPNKTPLLCLPFTNWGPVNEAFSRIDMFIGKLYGAGNTRELVATDFGITPDDGVNDLAAIAALLATSTADSPKAFYFPPGVYTLTNAGGASAVNVAAGFVGTIRGAGPDATIFDCSGYSGDCFTSSGTDLNRYILRDLEFRAGSTGTPIMVKVKRSDRDVRIENVNFSLPYGYGVMCDGCQGLRIVGGIAYGDGDVRSGKQPRAVYLQQSAQDVQIDGMHMDYLSDGVYCVGASATSPIRHVSIGNIDVDGGWWTQRARYANSGVTVSYTATTVVDSSTPFTASSVPVATVVKSMAVLGTGTVTSFAGAALVDSGITFSASIRRGDEVRTADAFAIVEQRLSNTSLALTEWRSLTTYRPVAVPAVGTAFTVYGITLGEAANSSNTTSEITVYRWFDVTGATATTPSAQARYEVAYLNPGYGVKSTINCDQVSVTNSTFRRTGASSIEFTGNNNIVAASQFRDGKDGAITFNGTFSTAENNVCDHMGRFCLGAVGPVAADSVFIGNTM